MCTAISNQLWSFLQATTLYAPKCPSEGLHCAKKYDS